ncbi:hypothetical protein HK098_001764 [Nowakowskiella sp. JEL0407]|nr:hypothetical protein HK098_001764 [Nowakowskiella sp. JEL0407]
MISIGQRVQTATGSTGTVRFVGETHFAPGVFVGIELDPDFPGKHNGTFEGISYFNCDDKRGVFVKQNTVKLLSPSPSPTTADLSKKNSTRISTRVSNRLSVNSVPNSPLSAGSTASSFEDLDSSNLSPPMTSKRTSRISTPSDPRRTSSISKPSFSSKSVGAPVVVVAKGRSRISAGRESLSNKELTATREDIKSRRESIASTYAKSSLKNTVDDVSFVTEEDMSFADVSQDIAPDSFELLDGDMSISMSNENLEARVSSSVEKLEQVKPVEKQETKQEVKEVSSSNPASQTSQNQVPATPSKPPVRRRLSQVSLLSSSFGISNFVKVEEPDAVELSGDAASKQIAIKMNSDMELMRLEMEEMKQTHAKQITDLTAKITFLESKRDASAKLQRDHDVLQLQHETLRIQLQTVSTQLHSANTELNTLRTDYEEVKKMKESLEKQLSDFEVEVEHAVLDKECAEAENDNLKDELEIVKRNREELEIHVEELKIELEIARLESTTDENTEPTATKDKDTKEAQLARENIRLQKQNEQLSEALVRLRDMMVENEEDLKVQIEILEERGLDEAEILDKLEKAEEMLRKKDEAITILKEQLDSAGAAMEIISMLTDKTQALQAERESLKADIEELEELKILSDEMEENLLENERVLLVEIDYRDEIIREMQEKVEAMDDLIVEKDSTLDKFREFVGELQREIRTLKTSNTHSSTPEPSLEKLNKELSSTASSTNPTRKINISQLRQIELELRKLDVSQMSLHLDLVSPFLTEAFFEKEHPGLMCVLLFKRMKFKAELVANMVVEFSGGAEKDYFVEMRQKLITLAGLSKPFSAFLECCSVENFVLMGKKHDDLLKSEERLNIVLECLKKDELKGTELLSDLSKSILDLEKLSEQFISSSKLVNVRQYKLISGTEILEVNCERVESEVKNMVSTFDKRQVPEEGVAEKKKIVKLLDNVVSRLKFTRNLAKKLSKRLVELCEINLTPRSESSATLIHIQSVSQTLVDYTLLFSSFTTQPISLAQLESESIKISAALSLPNNSKFGDAYNYLLDQITQGLNQISKTCEDAKTLERVGKVPTPWSLRGVEVLKEYFLNIENERKVKSLEEDVVRLVKEVKVKNQVIQEKTLQSDHLEKKIRESKKSFEEEKSRAITAAISPLEQVLAETHQQLEELEMENAQLKKYVKQLESNPAPSPRKAAISSPFKTDHRRRESGRANDVFDDRRSITSGYSESTNQIEVIMDSTVESELHTLKSALQYLRAENSRLKSSIALSGSSFLADSSDPLIKRYKVQELTLEPEIASELVSEPATISPRENSRQLGGIRASLSAVGGVFPVKPMKIAEPSISTLQSVAAPVPPKPVKPQSDELAKLAAETKYLSRDVSLMLTEPRVVDITMSASPAKWKPAIADPKVQREIQREQMASLAKKLEELNGKMQKLKQEKIPDTPNPLNSTTTSSKNNQSEIMFGRITVPKSMKLDLPAMNSGGNRLYVNSYSEFKQLHSSSPTVSPSSSVSSSNSDIRLIRVSKSSTSRNQNTTSEDSKTFSFRNLSKFQKICVILGVLAGIAVAVVLIVKYGHYLGDAFLWIANSIVNLGPWGVLLIGVLIILSAFPPLFGQVTLAYIAGFTYGLLKGFIIVYISSLIGALLAFIVTRTFFRNYYNSRFSKYSYFRALNSVLGKDGLKIAIMARYAPYPFGVLNVVLGLSPISFLHYLISTVIGLGKTLIQTYLGTLIKDITDAVKGGGILSMFKDPVRLTVGLISISIAIIVTVYCYFQMKKELAEESRESEEVTV